MLSNFGEDAFAMIVDEGGMCLNPVYDIETYC